MTDAFRFFLECINLFFIIYLIGYSSFLFLSVVAGAIELYKSYRLEQLHNKLWQSYYIPVSILVPAYNEEVTVKDTVTSLLNLDYKLYEIIVIDDGSKDKTSQVLIDAFHMERVERPIRHLIQCQPEEEVYECPNQKVPITLIRKKNGGKADSLNAGINSVRPANGVVIKKGHVIKYRLPRNIIARMQSLEYDRSFLAARILLDKINANMIISGAFGLFEKKAVIAVGGYDNSTMGEDMELVVRLHEFSRMNRKPYKIHFAQDAICWSQTPEKLSELCKQRKRWQRGLFQCMWGHRKMLANPRYGAVGLLSYLYFLLYELLSPFIELLGVLTMVLSVVMDMLNVKFMLVFLACYALYGILLTLTAYFSRIYTIDQRLSFRELILAIIACFFETTILRFSLAFVRATAFVGYKKNKLNWGKLERKKMNKI